TLSKTLFRRWIQRATLKHLSGLTDRNIDEGSQGRKPTNSPTPLQADLYDEWLDHLNTYPPILQPNGHVSRIPKRKNYTVETGHAGNSYIHFTLGGKDLFGSIQALFATEQIPNAIFAQVALFLDVDQKGSPINPYRELSSLHYQLLARPKIPKQSSFASNTSLAT
ncbi:hypothetical protein PSHT_12558, partial [Puccinia striiformis]